MQIDDLKKRLHGARKLSDGGFTARCPAHDDQKNSLSVHTDGERLLVKCFTGCSAEAICKSLNIEIKDLFINGSSPKSLPQKSAQPIKETLYEIVDIDGNVIARHHRMESSTGKTFKWSRPTGPGLWGMRVESLPLYGLRWAKVEPEDSIRHWIIVEGEKAADALTNAGLLALGTVTGASSCPSEESLMVLLARRGKIILWPDNDSPGENHMNKVAERLARMGIDPWIIKWKDAPPKGDAFDFLALEGDVNELVKTATQWGNHGPSGVTVVDGVIEQEILLASGNAVVLRGEDVRKEKTGIHAKLTIMADGERLAWDTFNIGRDADRVRISNSASKQLRDELREHYSDKNLKHDVDTFCAQLWDYQIEHNLGKLLNGCETPNDKAFILTPFVVRKGGTILFAPPGRGKSYLAMLMAVSIDSGTSSIWGTAQEKVLFINLERSQESMANRLAKVNKCLGLPLNRPLLFINARGRALVDVSDSAETTIRRFGVEVVFLDSISRAGMGDLNDNQPANKIVDTLNRISPSWLAIAHTPRSDEGHVFGSMHFDAGADVIIQVRTQEKDDFLGLGLQITKANDIKKPKLLSYALEFNGTGLAGARKANSGEFAELYAGVKRTMAEDIEAYVLDVGDASAKQISDATGRPYQEVSRFISHSGDYVRVRKVGKEVFYGLLSDHPQSSLL